MALKHFFWLRYPPQHIGGDETVVEKRFEVAGKPLSHYFDELGLWARRKRCRVIRLSDQLPVRHYYIPKSGDVIQMSRVEPTS